MTTVLLALKIMTKGAQAAAVEAGKAVWKEEALCGRK
jgi:hypothetical protein